MEDNTECPLVSVIMPVYNTGKYLKESIDSILQQTFRNFEFIIIDDGSTDDSSEIIRSFGDGRIVYVRNERNIGNYPARNIGARMAKGKYIAVMDSDDVAFPERLMKQFSYMEENQEIGVLGCRVRLSSGEVWRFSYLPKTMKSILLQTNCFCHPSMFIRKNILYDYNLFYNESFYYAADYDFLTRAIDFVEIRIYPEILLMYRLHEGQISQAKIKEQDAYADRIRVNYVKRTGVVFTDSEEEIFIRLLNCINSSPDISGEKYVEVADRLIEANKKSGYFDGKALAYLLALRLYGFFRW